MKYLIIFLIFLSTTLFSNTIKFAYNEEYLKEPIKKVIKDLEDQNITMYGFYDSKVYKRNGLLLGLIRGYIQLAFVEKSFLEEIVVGDLNNENLEKVNFSIIGQFDDIYIISRKKYLEELSKDKKSKIIEVLNKYLEGVEK